MFYIYSWLFKVQKRQCVCYLVVFVPRQGLCGQDEPVLFGSTLHDADVVDGEPAFTDHLQMSFQ